MWGYQNLGYRYRNTSHYSDLCRNYGDESSEEEGMEVSSVEESRGHRYLGTSQYSSSNRGGCESHGKNYKEPSHST